MKRSRRDVEIEDDALVPMAAPPPPQFYVLGIAPPGMHVPPPHSRFSFLDISPWTRIDFNFAVAEAQLRAVIQEQVDLTAHLGPIQAAWAAAPMNIVAVTRATQLTQAIAHAREQKRLYVSTLENLARYLMTKRPAEGIDAVIATIQEVLGELEPFVLMAGSSKSTLHIRRFRSECKLSP